MHSWQSLRSWPIRRDRQDVGGIRSLAFSPDDKHLATGGGDGLIKIWEIASGRHVRTFRVDAGPNVSALVYSPDGKHLASSNGDFGMTENIVSIFRKERDQDHSSSVRAGPLGCRVRKEDGAGERKEGLLRADCFCGAWIDPSFHRQRRHPPRMESHNASRVEKLGVAEAGSNEFVGRHRPVSRGTGRSSRSGGVGRFVRFDGPGGVQSLRCETSSPINDMAFSSNGDLFATCGRDVRIWETPSLKQARNPSRTSRLGVFRIKASPDGKQLVTGSGKGGILDFTAGEIRFWNVQTLERNRQVCRP